MDFQLDRILLYTMNTDGSNQTKLTSDTTRCLYPESSHDGKKIELKQENDMTGLRIYLIICITLGASGCLKAQSSAVTFFNPGMKAGYTFGEGGGFTLGLELSYTLGFTDKGIYGIVLDIDGWNNKVRVHLGVEAQLIFVGMCIGPTLTFGHSGRDLGFS